MIFVRVPATFIRAAELTAFRVGGDDQPGGGLDQIPAVGYLELAGHERHGGQSRHFLQVADDGPVL